MSLLHRYRRTLDLSVVQVDASHTRARSGGQATGYQGRKKSRTSNIHLLCDNSGLPLACGQPQEGQHHDLYDIEQQLNDILSVLDEAQLHLRGSFLNADAGFDSEQFRQLCQSKGIEGNIAFNPRNGSIYDRQEYFDDLLYQRRFLVERLHAWLDGFKALVLRYEKLAITWRALHFMAFLLISLRIFKLY